MPSHGLIQVSSLLINKYGTKILLNLVLYHSTQMCYLWSLLKIFFIAVKHYLANCSWLHNRGVIKAKATNIFFEVFIAMP